MLILWRTHHFYSIIPQVIHKMWITSPLFHSFSDQKRGCQAVIFKLLSSPFCDHSSSFSSSLGYSIKTGSMKIGSSSQISSSSVRSVFSAASSACSTAFLASSLCCRISSAAAILPARKFLVPFSFLPFHPLPPFPPDPV